MFIIKITLFYIREEILEVRLDFSCARFFHERIS